MKTSRNRPIKFIAALMLLVASVLFVWQRASSQIAPAPAQPTIRVQQHSMRSNGPETVRQAEEPGTGEARVFRAGELGPGGEPVRFFAGDPSDSPHEGRMRMGGARGETTPEQREQTRQAARQRLTSDPNSPLAGLSPADREAFLRKLDAQIEAGNPVIIEGRGTGGRAVGR